MFVLLRGWDQKLILERFSLDCRKGLVLVLVWFYYALWLASVFTFVLVLRQSSEKRSKALSSSSQQGKFYGTEKESLMFLLN